MNSQGADYIRDQLSRGLIDVAQANVELVRCQRFRLVINKLSRDVRCALNAAVKRGELGHMKKEGHKPEAYFHPTFDYLARAARNRAAEQVALAAKAVAGWPAA